MFIKFGLKVFFRTEIVDQDLEKLGEALKKLESLSSLYLSFSGYIFQRKV